MGEDVSNLKEKKLRLKRSLTFKKCQDEGIIKRKKVISRRNVGTLCLNEMHFYVQFLV